VNRARSLAERLTRLTDGLDADPEYSFNTVGEVQGNGVELDTWCMKLGFARDTLKLLARQRPTRRQRPSDASAAPGSTAPSGASLVGEGRDGTSD
jgi:hypothetical protein